MGAQGVRGGDGVAGPEGDAGVGVGREARGAEAGGEGGEVGR